jgi:hypothetical protein
LHCAQGEDDLVSLVSLFDFQVGIGYLGQFPHWFTEDGHNTQTILDNMSSTQLWELARIITNALGGFTKFWFRDASK